MAKVLHICSWYPTRCQPRHGNFVERHVGLIAAVHPSWVLQVDADPQLAPGHTEWVHTHTGQLHTLCIYFGAGRGQAWRLWQKSWLYLRGALALWRQAGGFDLLHVMVMFPALPAAYVFARLKGLPFLVTEHASLYSPESKRHLPRWLERLIIGLANRAEWCCPVSHSLARGLQARGLVRPQFRVISNSVSPAVFYPAATPPPRPLRFLHVSNFDPLAKNVEGLLRAFHQLVKEGHSARLTIAGDGHFGPLHQLADALGLFAPTLVFCGPLDAAEVGELMRNHHVFVLNSHFENQPCVVLEAQLCGLPVVATRVGDLPHLVDSSRLGILVPPGQPAQLVQALQQMLDAHGQFDTAAIAQQAASRYADEVVQQDYLQVYTQILHQK